MDKFKGYMDVMRRAHSRETALYTEIENILNTSSLEVTIDSTIDSTIAYKTVEKFKYNGRVRPHNYWICGDHAECVYEVKE